MKNRRFAWILLLAATVRMALWAASLTVGVEQGKDVALWPGVSWRMLTPDSDSYLMYFGPVGADDPKLQVFRTPGYPLLIDTCRLIGGRSGLAVLIALQVLMDLGVVWLTWRLAESFAGPTAGAVAALLHAINPLAAAMSLRILSETSFTLLLTAALVVLCRRGRGEPGIKSFCLAGVLLAAAGYVRPVGLTVWAVMALVLGIRMLRRRLGVPALMGFVAPVIVLCGPWVIRNGLGYGYWGFSSVGRVNRVAYEAASTVSAVEGVSLEAARERLARRIERRSPQRTGPVELRPAGRRVALEVLGEHTGTWLAVRMKGSAATLLPGVTEAMEVGGQTTGQRGTLDVLHRRGLLAAIGHYFGGKWWLVILATPLVLVLLGRYALAALAAVRGLPGSWAGWMLGMIVVWLTLAGGTASTPRFRVPMDPIISVAAGAGLAWLIRRRRLRGGEDEAAGSVRTTSGP
jgi:hypothetical protein